MLDVVCKRQHVNGPAEIITEPLPQFIVGFKLIPVAGEYPFAGTHVNPIKDHCFKDLRQGKKMNPNACCRSGTTGDPVDLSVEVQRHPAAGA